jgi:CubicO group peptidase (beta-lactamase class C family)
MSRVLPGLVLLAALVASAGAQTQRPSAVDAARFAGIDRVVEEAIAAHQTPGAVVLVGRGDEVVFEKAYGQRATVPSSEPMTLDTIFDLASLTKVVATTTAVMQLVEQGRLRLNDTVASFIPGFERYGKGTITVRHLLTHVSGLRPDVDLHSWEGYDAAIDLAREEVTTSPPGQRFVYSDINFFLLGDIVARISGLPLDQYVQRYIFQPLAMNDTGFKPAADKQTRTNRAVRHDGGMAVQYARSSAAPRHGARSDGKADGRGGRTRRPFQHRARFVPFRQDADSRWPTRRRAGAVGADGGSHDDGVHAAGHGQCARPWLGHRYDLLVESR